MSTETHHPNWLRQYGNVKEYQWQKAQMDGKPVLRRPLGMVEFSFDGDGRFFEGRADMTDLLEVNINSTLNDQQFRERILLVWTCLRCRHSMLRARSARIESNDPIPFAPLGMHFVIDCLDDIEQALDNARPHILFLEDHFESIDPLDFYHHTQNTARVVDPETALSRLFVFPIEKTEKGSTLRLFLNGGHVIWDGLTSHAWNRDFIKLLNDSPSVLKQKITSAINPLTLLPSLPLPQEALLPPIPGSPARQRWFWAIVRILRHVRRPLRAGFRNPLSRHSSSSTPPVVLPLPPTYHPILSYSKPPTLNTRTFVARIPTHVSSRLSSLCKKAGTSMGAGCFALAAVVMMEFHERLHPPSSSSSSSSHQDHISSFPLDARAFLQPKNSQPLPAESLMLAFSDGLALPFLPSHLNLAGRLRLLARRAHVQLAAYQKSKKELGPEQVKRGKLTSRGAGLVLANQYLSSFERVAGVIPEDLRDDGTGWRRRSTQGEYPLRKNPTMATNGVSSVGKRDGILRRGEYGLDLDGGDKDLAADFVDMRVAVRAREGEFLVAVGTAEDGLFVSCSADITTLDPELIEQWRMRIEHVLDDLEDDVDDGRKAKL